MAFCLERQLDLSAAGPSAEQDQWHYSSTGSMEGSAMQDSEASTVTMQLLSLGILDGQNRTSKMVKPWLSANVDQLSHPSTQPSNE